MRIHGTDPDSHEWRVFHVEECRQLRHVQWVDDELRQWSQYLVPVIVNPDTGDVASRIHDAKRIRIIPEMKLILINPADDPTEEERIAAEEIACQRLSRKLGMLAWRDGVRAAREKETR